VVAATLTPMSLAQMHGGFGPGAPGIRGFGPGGHHGPGFGGSLFLWGGPSYADYPAGSWAYAAPAPPVVIVQPPPAAAAPEPKPEPLLIEWQGDRYVRFRGQHESAEKSSPDYSEGSEIAPARLNKPVDRAPAPGDELPPAVLVYRDGHREETSNYVITDEILYARGDSKRGEFWTRTIRVSALDVPATLKANQENGVKFVLPSWPNEVVTRP